MTDTTTVRLYWRDGDTVTQWNEHLAWTCETFGLPGDLYAGASTTEDYMEFHFKHEKHATLFRLKFGGVNKI